MKSCEKCDKRGVCKPINDFWKSFNSMHERQNRVQKIVGIKDGDGEMLHLNVIVAESCGFFKEDDTSS
jgi:hypothetical protein